LAQVTDNSAEEENQLFNNEIVQILYDGYGVGEDEIEEYRIAYEFGYGEILILYALANAINEEMDDGIISEILGERNKKGWGEIAKKYGLKLGEVISSAMKKHAEENSGNHHQEYKNNAKNNNEHPGKGKGRSGN